MDMLLRFNSHHNELDSICRFFDHISCSGQRFLVVFHLDDTGNICIHFLQCFRLDHFFTAKYHHIKQVRKSFIAAPKLFEYHIVFCTSHLVSFLIYSRSRKIMSPSSFLLVFTFYFYTCLILSYHIENRKSRFL